LLSYSDGFNIREYVSNIGLALRQARAESSPARVTLNVTPEVYLPKPFPVIQLASWAFIVLAIAVLLLFGISTMQSYSDTLSLQTQVNSAQTQVDIRRGTEAAIEQLKTQIKTAESAGATFTQPLDSAKAQRAKVNGDLSKVTSLLPGIIKITAISYSTSVAITGTAPDNTIIVDYVRALTNSGRFSSILITNMNEVQYNQWAFTLTLK
jgi:cell division protein FtsL